MITEAHGCCRNKEVCHYVIQPSLLSSLSTNGQRAFIFKQYHLSFLIFIFYGQGAKAAQKRERNAEKSTNAKGSKSQAKVNEAAKSIVCSTCKQSFVSFRAPFPVFHHWWIVLDSWLLHVRLRKSSSYPLLLCKPTHATNNSLEEHSANKHSKTMAECFPNFGK